MNLGIFYGLGSARSTGRVSAISRVSFPRDQGLPKGILAEGFEGHIAYQTGEPEDLEGTQVSNHTSVYPLLGSSLFPEQPRSELENPSIPAQKDPEWNDVFKEVRETIDGNKKK